MSDISLSKAVRSNLLSLQNTASLMEKTQNRLATGNKVNSALDNPTNFFTASALNSRAGDLAQLLDGMANGIQTLQAADNGLTAITKNLESMQSVLRQARQDKSFHTASYEISPGATGNISFADGSIGPMTRSIPLQNLALTPEALGMDSATGTQIPGTPAGPTSGTASFTMAGALGLGDDTVTFTVTVNGAPQTITLDAASLNDAGVGADINDNDDLVEVLNDQLTGASASVVDGEIVIRSGTTGATSSIAIGAATRTNGTDGTPDANLANLGLDAASSVDGLASGPAIGASNTLTWPGTPIEVNNDAKINFTAKINGVDQTVIITRKDVLKVGNGDGTINSASEFAAILAAKIDGVTASASSDTITITSKDTGPDSGVEIGAATITGRNYDSDELVRMINTNEHLKDRVRASNDNGKLRIENQSTQELSVNGVDSAGTIVGNSTTGQKIIGNTVRADLTKQFNELRDQLDKLSDDASFNGVNLLRGDQLTILFNETGTSAIDVQTKDQLALNSAKLNLFNLEPKELDLDMDIDEFLDTVKNALSHVRTQASTFGQNLSMVENRQAFTKNMINTLETGAANLTLADMNEEAANLLALQTRQQLSSNSLSLASQADQSVLQLLR
ncbi:flagellin [Devosia sp. YIM 151766]|uniref:flagellin N-terminal helical domain-containing protein n=1 Tax=Devosia sp. YIM 151766 TaxID=3017325 RepID=UPI00255C321E|nr:flagellin [Devosia sp. YIM 151766]WIY51650.1 flagellin [Devosia sp. YIM 151766]